MKLHNLLNTRTYDVTWQIKFINSPISQCLWSPNLLIWRKHSHKKQKVSLETRIKQAVIRAYVENQAIIESILLYRASKHKQTKKPAIKTFCELPFSITMWLISGFFLSSVNIQTCRDQTLSKMLQLFKETNYHSIKHRTDPSKLNL